MVLNAGRGTGHGVHWSATRTSSPPPGLDHRFDRRLGWAAEAAPPWSSRGVPGRPEFSVETLSAEGKHAVLAVTGKHTSGPPHFVEVGHDLPAELEHREYEAVTAAAIGVLDAIGYRWGAATPR